MNDGKTVFQNKTFWFAVLKLIGAGQPSCTATARGLFWVTNGGAGVKDTVQVCAKDASDAYAWRTIY